MTSETTDQRVAAQVRGHIARVRLRQIDVANAVGMSQPALSRRLAGTCSFSIDELSKIAEVVDVPVAVLLAEITPTVVPAVSA